DACHAATPRPGVARVRVPGENGLARYREQRAQGVALHPTILPALAPWATRLNVPAPAALAPA
ncbi:MAG: Ldh family oxidoreductase, partial [Casimicrobiaceae bacterium]